MFSRKYLAKHAKQTYGRSKSLGISSCYNTQIANMLTKNRVLFKPTSTSDPFANGTSSVYMEQMYDQWRKDPDSVQPSWRSYFQNIEDGATIPYSAPPTLGRQENQVNQLLAMLQQGTQAQPPQRQTTDVSRTVTETSKLMLFIRAFMTHGHLTADVDPLKLAETYQNIPTFTDKLKLPTNYMTSLVDYKSYGFTEADLDRDFYIDAPELAGLLRRKKQWKLRELIDAYKTAYCQKIGIEYMHIADRTHCNWIRDRFESLQFEDHVQDHKLQNYERLIWATQFGGFLEGKFNTMKRFGLEGCESFIPGLKFAMDRLVEKGCQEVVIGMPHRGRLNVLSNVVRKPMEQIFAEFQGRTPKNMSVDDWGNTGDVKYHLGTSYTRTYPNGKKLTATLLANPSHLEAVNPVVMGRVRAEQHFMQDHERTKVCPILIHGDASFAGQGVVYEAMQMQNLPNYSVGGTIHVVVNNQIGFTTTPQKARSAQYCTDLAKSIDAPIFHVNGDSCDDVAKVFQIAADYRQKFHHDVVIDLIGYRKYGHNELDQPSFTQPLMYKVIQKMTPVDKKYEQQLIDEGVLTAEKAKKIRDDIKGLIQKAYEQSKSHDFKLDEWLSSEWKAIKKPEKFGLVKDTGVQLNVLKSIGEKISTLPEDWDFHSVIKKIFTARKNAIKEGKGIDMGTAEALAFATLIDEGFHVRLSGQDVERGTFSHRHAVVFNQSKDSSYIPINSVKPNAEIQQFTVTNSHLSEFAVMGYEYGYSCANPNTLTIWEAQFGDFANGAQVIIDTFLNSGEAKWQVKNGLVLNLPHGYDGQGPEHSNARLERFLSLCDESDQIPEKEDKNSDRMERVNMQVANCSESSNYFHVLRRQLRRPFRKPLVLMMSKKLLKSKDAASNIEEFDEGLRFKRIIANQDKDMVADDKVKRVILCSGQVFYDIEGARKKEGRNDIQVIRVEQLCPFPFRVIIPEVERFKNAEVMWVQEEPQNYGAYTFVLPRLQNIMRYIGRKPEISYSGRDPSASSSTGYAKVHEQELKNFLKKSMS